MSGILVAAGSGFAPAAGGGPATFSDNFNRTENPLSNGGTWTVLTSGDFAGSMQTVTSVAEGVAHSGQDVAAYVNSPTFAADQQVEVTVTSALTDSISVGVRFNPGTGAGYMAHLATSTSVSLYKMPGFNSLTSWGPITALTAGHTFGLQVTGTTTTHIVLLRDGVPLVDTYDDSSSPITSGQPWMHMYDSGSGQTVDAFSATDL